MYKNKQLQNGHKHQKCESNHQIAKLSYFTVTNLFCHFLSSFLLLFFFLPLFRSQLFLWLFNLIGVCPIACKKRLIKEVLKKKKKNIGNPPILLKLKKSVAAEMINRKCIITTTITTFSNPSKQHLINR